MRKVPFFLLLASISVLIGCASESDSETKANGNSNAAYRENNPNAEPGVDTPIWSTNPNKPTVTKRIEDATNDD
jgi:hypothetical protein